MWAYDFLKGEAEAKPLRSHLHGNNIFLRFYYPEYYLEPQLRLSFFPKLVRLCGSLLLYWIVVAFVLASKDFVYGYACTNGTTGRTSCKVACIFDNFPNLPCVIQPDVTVTYAGNKYEKLYQWTLSDTDYSQEPWNDCKSTLPEDYYSESMDLLWSYRLPRTQVCFKPCKDAPSTTKLSMYGKEYLESRRTNSLPTTITEDDRPLCTDPGAKTDADTLLCVDSADTCETTVYEHEVCPFGEYTCFTWSSIVVCIAFSLPILFLFDALQIYSCSIGNKSGSVRGGFAKCGFQWIIFSTWMVIIVLFVHLILRVYAYSRPSLVWTTYFLTVFFDQIRNILVQAPLHFIILRRCGQVPIKDLSEEKKKMEEDAGPGFEVVRKVAIFLVESRKFDLAVYSVVGLYAIFILAFLAITDYLSPEANNAMELVDTVFLIIFVMEILLRLVAHGLWYLLDPWSFFDTVVVFVSLLFKLPIMSNMEGGNSMALLRLLRLLRLVLVLRKASATKRKPQSGSSTLQFSSPVERVLEIFNQTKEMKGVPASLLAEINWACEIISGNKLYSISVDTEKSKSTDPLLDTEIQDWLKYASDPHQAQTTSWKDNELEKYLLGQTRRKEHEECLQQAREALEKEVHAVFDAQKQEMLEGAEGAERGSGGSDALFAEMMSGASSMQMQEDTMVTLLDDGLQHWEFDIHGISSALGPMTLPLIVVSACIQHELLPMLEVSFQSVLDYMIAVETGYIQRNPYHNSLHAADVVQSFHCFISWFAAENAANNVVTSQDIFAGIFAAAVHDFEHPGVNNLFLTRIKHPIAIRYNDFSVLENHHVSSAFTLMMKMPNDPFASLSEAQYFSVRKMMIQMILATDTSNHFSELSLFKTKLHAAQTQGHDFPDNRYEDDKQILMNVLLHSADIGNPCRATAIYTKWISRVMEEFFRQGDLEREKNLPVSMFFDRENTSVAKCQLGFIDVLVLPLFTVLSTLIPQVGTHCIANLERNRSYIRKQVEPAQGNDGEDGKGHEKKRATAILVEKSKSIRNMGRQFCDPKNCNPKNWFKK